MGLLELLVQSIYWFVLMLCIIVVLFFFVLFVLGELIVCDLFCMVIDNFGDIGVCWCVVCQFVYEYGWQVCLFVDDLYMFVCLLLEVDFDVIWQMVDVIVIEYWYVEVGDVLDIVDVVIEVFVCELFGLYFVVMV